MVVLSNYTAVTSPDTFQELMVSLTRAFGWHRPTETPCGRPVPISEAHALLELSRGSALTQQDLADALGLRKSTVSRMVGNLVERGWVERSRSPCDGRAWTLTLTASGEDAAASLAEARRAKMDRILARLPEKERDGVITALATLIEAIHESDS